MKQLLVLISVCLLAGCSTVKDVPYFQNAAEYDGSKGAILYDMAIKPKDLLTIFVYSATNKEAAIPFNVRDPRPINEVDTRAGGVRLQQSYGQVHHYLVENDGTIDFPIVGRVPLAGLTIEQANATIKAKIAPYFKDPSDYIVNTIIENYVITVMGEVKRPNSFTITRNKCTILEALALAGSSVRWTMANTRSTSSISVMPTCSTPPYYYLEQRDILYVEPNEVMAQNAKIGRTRQLWVRGAQITISLGSLLYRVLN